ncbi:MAG: zf-HC2 domain-containing protein [Lentisphaeria bacterium]|nr:zf-HC2 domain-containing protein [Lentisphaeria bacterium]
MQEEIHRNIRGWLEASLKGRLSPAQRAALKQHLAECRECLRAGSDPEVLDLAADILSRRHGPGPDFETRMVDQVRRGVSADGEAGWRRRGARIRFWVRAGLAGMLLVLLAVRSLDRRYFREDSWEGRTLSAVSQVFLREPRFDGITSLPPETAAEERRFAIAHQVTKSCVGMLLWLGLGLLVTLLVFDARHLRRGLASGPG